jgi:hypothetical protein
MVKEKRYDKVEKIWWRRKDMAGEKIYGRGENICWRRKDMVKEKYIVMEKRYGVGEKIW